MRLLFLSLVLLTTSQVHALTQSEAEHFVRRLALSSSTSSVTQVLPLSRSEAVNLYLNQTHDRSVLPSESIINPPAYPDKVAPEIRKLFFKRQREDARKLRAFWVERMIKTSTPFNELMTLFWQGFFTTEIQKIQDPALMYGQFEILERYGLEDFGTLLKKVMSDPAIIIYLDNQKNRKAKPNENLARELMELYTLGEGNYSELDVKEVARALTGWSANKSKRTFVFDEKNHDHGEKLVLGKKGNWSMPDVLDILLSDEHTAKYVVKRLWHFFVSPTISEERLVYYAEQFRRTGYEIRPLLSEMFKDEAFWREENQLSLVRSPIEVFIAMYRDQELTSAPYQALVRYSDISNHDLFNPPSVKGWPVASTEWINTLTIVSRQSAIKRLANSAKLPEYLNNQIDNPLFFKLRGLEMKELDMNDKSWRKLSDKKALKEAFEHYSNLAYQLR